MKKTLLALLIVLSAVAVHAQTPVYGLGATTLNGTTINGTPTLTQILIAQGPASAVWKTMSGDCTMLSTGVISCTSHGGQFNFTNTNASAINSAVSSTTNTAFNSNNIGVDIDAPGSKGYGLTVFCADRTNGSIQNHIVCEQAIISDPNHANSGSDHYGYVVGFNPGYPELYTGPAIRGETQNGVQGSLQYFLTALPGFTPTFLFAQPSCYATAGTCGSAALSFQGYNAGSGSSIVSIYGGSDGNFHAITPSGYFYIDPLGTATSSLNYASAKIAAIGSCWNGTAALNDYWYYAVTYYPTAGANPHSQMSWGHTGCSGGTTWQFPSGTVVQNGGTTLWDGSGNFVLNSFAFREGAQITAASTITLVANEHHVTGATAINLMVPPANWATSVTAGSNTANSGGVGGFVTLVADGSTTINAGTSYGAFKYAEVIPQGTSRVFQLGPSDGLWRDVSAQQKFGKVLFLATMTASGANDSQPATTLPMFVNGAVYQVSTAPVGCTTYPTIALYDATAGTSIATATLASGVFSASMTVSSPSVPVGDVIRWQTTVAPVGCSTNAAFGDISFSYN